MLKYKTCYHTHHYRTRMRAGAAVTALTLAIGFTSHAAAAEKGKQEAASVSGADRAISVCVARAAGERSVNLKSGIAACVQETIAKKEEEARELEEQRKAREAARQAEEAKRQQEEALASEAEAVQSQTGTYAAAVSGSDRELLASIIFCEAGNQSFVGQVAVGAVVMNRLASGAYPDSLEEVIYQPGQFSPAGSGWLDQVRSAGGYTSSALQAADAALAGENPVGNCLYFDQGGYGMQIGAHYFH